jgi:hypothetical protein
MNNPVTKGRFSNRLFNGRKKNPVNVINKV